MPKTPHIIPNLNTEQFRDLKRVMFDIFYFASKIFVIHPIRGKVRFNLYPYQKSVLHKFLTERFLIILKFRQAGITELISMYALWLAMYHSNKNIQIISIKDRVAKKVLRKIKYMYKNLPNHLQVEIVNGRSTEYGTAEEIVFGNGSTITSMPTTEDAGRSEAVTLLVIDEAAIVRWASTIWAAAFPTLSTGGSAIVNSTPYGVGNWYHSQWVNSISGGNAFMPIRLFWKMHPERNQDWYDKMSSSLGPRRTAQEIDGDFLTSGYSVFNLDDIRAIENTLSDYMPIETGFNGNLRIFKEAGKNDRMYIGADIATGRSRDYSAFTIMDRYGEEYGCFRGKIPVDHLSDLLMKMGKRFNNATLAPETNDIGLAVTSLIQKAGYNNLYYSQKLLKKKKSRKPEMESIPGWLTTSKNRPVILDELEADVRNSNQNEEGLEGFIIKDPFFIQEAYTFIYDERNRPVALGKDKASKGDEESETSYTDDSIMAKAITNFIRKGKIKTSVTIPV